ELRLARARRALVAGERDRARLDEDCVDQQLALGRRQEIATGGRGEAADRDLIGYWSSSLGGLRKPGLAVRDAARRAEDEQVVFLLWRPDFLRSPPNAAVERRRLGVALRGEQLHELVGRLLLSLAGVAHQAIGPLEVERPRRGHLVARSPELGL